MRTTTDSERIAELEEVVKKLSISLKWMVENDETNEGDAPVECLHGKSWNDVNDYWIIGKQEANASLEIAEKLVPTEETNTISPM